MQEKLREAQIIRKQISDLPKGNITYKTIRGARRMYLQWNEDGKKQSRYIRACDERKTEEQVAKREELKDRLIRLEASMRFSVVREADTESADEAVVVHEAYETRVVTGKELTRLCSGVEDMKRRECFSSLKKYLDSKHDGRVCILYGLRRTGKTVMLLQAISETDIDDAAYIKILSSDTMAMLNRDLRHLSEAGISYVFIDEITLMSDFIDSASLLSDIYATSGMKIVLSGTDSLGFALSMDDELYDRAHLIHTTFIPFREYSRLLGISDVDEYIRYGGTLRAGELGFADEEFADGEAAFRDDESTRRYIDTSIARNIQHSLSGYQAGGHFRHLIELYEAGELTNVINRLVEDMNHRFLLSVLERDFVSHDLGSSRQIERKRAAASGVDGMLEEVDEAKITYELKRILDIRDRDERRVELSEDHIKEIMEYLFMLDLIVDVTGETVGGESKIEHIVFSQPGMRYCQAQALVYSLMKDEVFLSYPLKQRRDVTDMILEEVRGRMLEEIVLLETIKALPRGKRAFKLEFAVGEFDMVVCDERELSCEIYEIKHSRHTDPSQYRHLTDKEKCKATEMRYGEIKDRIVLYNGEDTAVKSIHYRNVAAYLENLGCLR